MFTRPKPKPMASKNRADSSQIQRRCNAECRYKIQRTNYEKKVQKQFRKKPKESQIRFAPKSVDPKDKKIVNRQEIRLAKNKIL